MHYRTLGSSGITVSTVGFGAWGIGGRTAEATSYGATDDRVSRSALETAYDRGITFFDTADVYGDGRSEVLIGETFQGRRDRVVFATKAGMLPGYVGEDFSRKALRRSLEGSLRRLRTDYVDILQLHNPAFASVWQAPEILETLRHFRSEGKIRAYGVSTKTPAEALEFLMIDDLACLQVNVNLLDWRARDCGLFEAAMARGIGVIARTPLGFGFLAGDIRKDTVFADGDHRGLWDRTRIVVWLEAADAIFAALGPIDRSQAALRFCLSFPAVATAIPGMLKPEEVVANAEAADQASFTVDELSRIEHIYRQYASRLAV